MEEKEKEKEKEKGWFSGRPWQKLLIMSFNAFTASFLELTVIL